MKKIIVLMMVIVLSACTDPEGAKKALKSAGYTEVQIKGSSFFSCGQDDVYRTEFTAKGPTGVHTEGVVCKGFFKGSTVRTD